MPQALVRLSERRRPGRRCDPRGGGKRPSDVSGSVACAPCGASRNVSSISEASMDLPSIIPVFPLPNVVLFPGVPLPLHIFEPRYRDMVRDASAGHEIIGMVLLARRLATALPREARHLRRPAAPASSSTSSRSPTVATTFCCTACVSSRFAGTSSRSPTDRPKSAGARPALRRPRRQLPQRLDQPAEPLPASQAVDTGAPLAARPIAVR